MHIDDSNVWDKSKLMFVFAVTSKQPIPVEEFLTHVADMHCNDDYRFSIEYPVRYFGLRFI